MKKKLICHVEGSGFLCITHGGDGHHFVQSVPEASEATEQHWVEWLKDNPQTTPVAFLERYWSP